MEEKDDAVLEYISTDVPYPSSSLLKKLRVQRVKTLQEILYKKARTDINTFKSAKAIG